MAAYRPGVSQQYQTLIDWLVHACHEGQGRIGPDRVRRGVWSSEAVRRPDELPDEQRINALLAGLSADDREVIARMLGEAFQSGVHEALVVLHAGQVPPFEDGYEGTPFHDFTGRLQGWPWPDG